MGFLLFIIMVGGSMTINIQDEEIQAKAEAYVEKHGLQADLSDISQDMYEEVLKMFEDKLLEFGIERKGYFDNWKLTCEVYFKEEA
jgi:hypothetical protein